MKKRIASIAVIAMAAIIMMMVLVGCGAHSSSESIATQYIKSSVAFDFDKALECFYFKDDDTKNKTKSEMEETKKAIDELYSSYSISFSNVSYEKKSSLTDAELAEFTALYGKDVTEGEKGEIKYDAKVTYKLSMDFLETEIAAEGSIELKAQTSSIITIKIEGKWYIDYYSEFINE